MLRSLGRITATAGTPVRVTNNESEPTRRYPCHSFMVEALPTNTGRVFIGTATMNTTTMAGVYAILPIPTANILPSFSATITYAPGGLNLQDIYIDVAVSDEGALVSAIIA